MTTPPHVDTPEWTAHKAWAGAIVGALVGALSALTAAMGDGVTTNELIDIVLAAVLGSGLTGAIVWRVPNHRRPHPHRR